MPLMLYSMVLQAKETCHPEPDNIRPLVRSGNKQNRKRTIVLLSHLDIVIVIIGQRFAIELERQKKNHVISFLK